MGDLNGPLSDAERIKLIDAKVQRLHLDFTQAMAGVLFPNGREAMFQEGMTMRIEDKVCSLEMAKKLRELGVTQNSQWYWVKDGEKDVVISGEDLILAGGLPTNRNVYSAFTAVELGNLLISGKIIWAS